MALMQKSTQVIFQVLLIAWEFPQTVVGLGVYVWMKARRRVVRVETVKYRVFIETKNKGVSLGCFIFWAPSLNRFPSLVNDCRMHEYGHARQSAMLGPFYLLVVGIPSLMRVLYSKWFYRKYGRTWTKYFDGFPEKWADRLGGVTKS